SVLLEITRPPDAAGRWLEARSDPPRPGYFCMVGDFQQSIFGDRADLKNYETVHDALIETGSATALTFSVTFRLDETQVDFVNRTFREILNKENGQVQFVELQPRPKVLPGQVIRVVLPGTLLPEGKLKDYQKANIAAKELARWIKETGLEGLRASSWRDVAILCPRKAWLRTMARALRKIDVPVAMQSESAIKADSPAYAWLTALCTIMAEPLNGYEIAGVLREVFGISDHDLAIFSEGEGSRFRIDEPTAAAGIVSSRLRALAETRDRLEGKSLFQTVTMLVRETELGERLASLPSEDFDDLPRELDALLARAADAEAQGATLTDFAENLRADFETPRDARLSSENGIQLITGQKAKGSEWQAVILPFLGRDIRSPSPRYPSLIKTPGSGEILVALSKEDPSDDLKKARTMAEQQEMQRLLYVATTRARHTLVLALDRELFLDKKGALSSRAQLTLLGNEKNPAQFDELPEKPEACPLTLSASVENQSRPDDLISAPAPVDPKHLERARRRASEFVHKFNPSAYDSEITPDASEGENANEVTRVALIRSAPDTPATLYGRWWHSFFQRMPWQSGIEKADALFQDFLAISPDKRRSAAEWKVAREGLAGDSILKQFLSRKNVRINSEFPFAWGIDERGCVEGLIDLLIIDPDAGECLLIDWKTNRIGKGEEGQLRLRYRPQIAAYWKSLREITKCDVDAGIFATATGKFVAYETHELEAEWTRLRAMPAERLVAEVSTL
ncbi:MAG TPA: 3'-5' exonuclease, partial [Chthoniobacterales bacterium]|nr:3'-5' exonuclease [Chthoniobacterales bacterium]